MLSEVVSNFAYNEIEYFVYINLLILSLLFFYMMLFMIIYSSSLILNSVFYNDVFIEIFMTFISFIYIILIISPGLLLFLDYDFISSLINFNVYILGYQWAWNYNILFNNLSYSFDQLILSSSSLSFSSYGCYPSVSYVHASFNSSLVLLLSSYKSYSSLLLFEFWLWNSTACLFAYACSSLLVYLSCLFQQCNWSITNCKFWLCNSAVFFCLHATYTYFLVTYIFTMGPLTSIFPITLSLGSLTFFFSPRNYLSYVFPNIISSVSSSSYGIFSSFYLCLFSSYLILSLYSTISMYVYSFDVIHSFGYHSLGFKSDAIPGRVNLVSSLSLLFNGFFLSFCYELCGSAHTSMLSSIISLSFLGVGASPAFSVCSVTTIDGHAYLDCPFIGTFFGVIAVIFFIFSSIILILYLYKIGFSSPSLIITFILSTLLIICNILLIAGLSFKYFCFCVFFNYLTFFTSTWIFFIAISLFINAGHHLKLYRLIRSIFK